MSVGQRLKEFRQIKNITQGELARYLDILQSNLHRYESDASKLTTDKLEKLRNHGVNIDWLITGQGEMFLGSGEISPVKREDVVYVKMPDVSVSAGLGIENFEDFPAEKLVAISRELIGVEISNPKDCMILKVFGNSMQPKIDNGDAIFVQKLAGMPLYFEGSFLVNYGGQLFVKNVQFKKGRVVLISLNKDYEDIVIENHEDSDIPLHIIGRVLTVLKPF